jgi:hypothetical protein
MIGMFVVTPLILTIAINKFSDKVKYITLPIILINILFVFALIIISQISLIWFIKDTQDIVLKVVHLINYCLIGLTAIFTYVMHRCRSQFD